MNTLYSLVEAAATVGTITAVHFSAPDDVTVVGIKDDGRKFYISLTVSTEKEEKNND